MVYTNTVEEMDLICGQGQISIRTLPRHMSTKGILKEQVYWHKLKRKKKKD